MKLTTVLFAASAFLSSVAFASNCYEPYLWCGWDLLEEGDYESWIKVRLRRIGIEPTTHNINHSLWKCTNSDTGDIVFKELCKNCKYGGNSQSDDFCRGGRTITTKNKRSLRWLNQNEE